MWSKDQRGNAMKKIEKILREMLGTFKCTKVCIRNTRRGRKKGAGKKCMKKYSWRLYKFVERC